MNCDSCDAIFINGILCHELGCPEKSIEKQCKECGDSFKAKDWDIMVCLNCQWEMQQNRR